jgi:DNA-binding MarR family transcriptional regulator
VRQASAADVRIADSVHSAAIHLLRRLRVEDRATGLSGPRLSALSVIVFNGPIAIGDLAAAEQVRPPTMTNLVRELEREGFVRRTTDPDDKRVQRVRATPRGRRLLERGRAQRIARLAADIATLTEEDHESLLKAARLLEALSSANRSSQKREGSNR